MAYSAPRLLFYTLVLVFSHLPPESSRTLASNTDKVSVSLYYESLCPYSANFIVNYLAGLVQDHNLLSIVDLHLSPWGNAVLDSNDSFVCQHGPYECLLNTVEACAIHVWPQLSDHFPFIDCIESLVYKRKYTEWESCFETLGLDPKPVTDCYSSGDGKKLELQHAAETDALVPPHEYVPWVVVDGQPLYEDYENFVSYICKAYDGTATPTACNDLSHSIKRGKTRPSMRVSFKETNMPKFIEQRTSAM